MALGLPMQALITCPRLPSISEARRPRAAARVLAIHPPTSTRTIIIGTFTMASTHAPSRSTPLRCPSLPFRS